MKNYTTVLFVCLLPFFGRATTYYVAGNGNDTNDGLTTSTAWQTISKVNATSLQPGDQVLFRSGDTFYGKIILPQSSNTEYNLLCLWYRGKTNYYRIYFCYSMDK